MNRAAIILWISVVVAAVVMPLYPLQILETGAGLQYELRTFSSYTELRQYIEESLNNAAPPYVYDGKVVIEETGSSPKTMTTGENTHDFSTTNVQVEGVDEMDIVKTDGEYIYLARNDMLYIIKAYPWQNATILFTMEMNYTIRGLFLSADRLIVLGTSYTSPPFRPYLYRFPGSGVVEIYDTSSKDNPVKVSRIDLEGTIFNARMVEDHIYVITTESPYVLIKKDNTSTTITPPEIIVNGERIKIPPEKIYHPPESQYDCIMAYVTAIDITNGNVTDDMAVITGTTTTMYASHSNLYLACIDYGVYHILESDDSLVYETTLDKKVKEKTIIYRISMKEGKIKYACHGEIPGRILNQFSMDEHGSFFRIATTSGDVWNGNSTNGVYILDMKLQIVASLENIAPGERIYAVRFYGDRAYVVTFRNIDPFFVLDLSNPYHPEILGELKLPGFSTYLHPYDESHIIGIGRETTNSSYGQTIITGLKISFFDVSDPENPVEISREVIEGESIICPALWDHKALLFDRDKHLLVIPVTKEHFFIKAMTSDREEVYTSIPFSGVYVYSVDPSSGVIYVGKVPQNDSMSTVNRILYIDNVLYTISDGKIRMTDLSTLRVLGDINLPIHSIHSAAGDLVKILRQS